MVPARMIKPEQINNDEFTVCKIAGKPLRVRQLSCAGGMEWSAKAAVATAARDAATDYGEMRDAIEAMGEVLAEYDGITADHVAAMTTAQIEGCMEALREANDPFVRRRLRDAEKQDKDQALNLELMKSLPTDSLKVILQQATAAQSAQLESNLE
jgi:hypothetical protein